MKTQYLLKLLCVLWLYPGQCAYYYPTVAQLCINVLLKCHYKELQLEGKIIIFVMYTKKLHCLENHFSQKKKRVIPTLNLTNFIDRSYDFNSPNCDNLSKCACLTSTLQYIVQMLLYVSGSHNVTLILTMHIMSLLRSYFSF